MHRNQHKLTAMIHSHLYTNKLETPLYAEVGGVGEPICKLDLNNWVGVLEKKDGWYRVVSVHCVGWVNKEFVEERSPFNLHVRWEPGKPIQYVSAA